MLRQMNALVAAERDLRIRAKLHLVERGWHPEWRLVPRESRIRCGEEDDSRQQRPFGNEFARQGVTPTATKGSEHEIVVAEVIHRSYELTGHSKAFLLVILASLAHRLRDV